MLKQIARRADDELQCPRRQHVRFDHDAHRGCGEIRGCARRFHNRGQAGEERRRELFQHAPDRKIERVDVDGHALQRGVDVQALEASALGQALHRAVDQDALVRQFTPALALIDRERADAAVNIDPGIGLGGAGIVRKRVELLLTRT